MKLEIQSEGQTFLEVGPYYHPAITNVLTHPEAAKKFRGVTYICIDDDTIGPYFKNLYSDHTQELRSAGFHKVAFEDLDMPEGCVDEIYMANVFGENLWRLRGPDFNWGIGGKFLDESEHLPLAHKFLKDSGRLTIVETTTPPEPVSLTDELKDSGFEVERIVYSHEADWEFFRRTYSITQYTNCTGYLIIARKAVPLTTSETANM